VRRKTKLNVAVAIGVAVTALLVYLIAVGRCGDEGSSAERGPRSAQADGSEDASGTHTRRTLSAADRQVLTAFREKTRNVFPGPTKADATRVLQILTSRGTHYLEAKQYLGEPSAGEPGCGKKTTIWYDYGYSRTLGLELDAEGKIVDGVVCG